MNEMPQAKSMKSLYKQTLGQAVFILLAVFPSPSQGQMAVLGRISNTTGFASNMNSAPSDPGPGELSPEADGYNSVSPGIDLAYAPRNMYHTIGYAFFLYIPFRYSEARSYSHSGFYRAELQTSATTTLGFELLGLYGNQRTMNLMQGASALTPGTQALEETNYVNAQFTERLGWRLDERWAAAQEFGFLATIPTEDSTFMGKTYAFSNSFELGRQWRVDRLSGILSGIYGLSYRPLPEPPLPPDQTVDHQLIFTLLGEWGHEFSETWRMALGAGLALGFQPGGDDEVAYGPAGRGSLTYHRDPWEITLAASHLPAIDPIAGNIVTRDEVGLTALYPISRELGLLAEGSVGYAFSRSMSRQSDIPDDRHNILADAALGWELMQEIMLSLRYQFIYQHGVLPEEDRQITVSNHQVLLTITAGYSLGVDGVARTLGLFGRERLHRANQDDERDNARRRQDQQQ